MQSTSRKLGFSLFDYSDSFSWLDLLRRLFCDWTHDCYSSFLNTILRLVVVLFPLGWKLMSHSLLHIVTFPSTSGKGPALCPRLVKYQCYNSKAIQQQQKKSICSCFLLDIIYHTVLLFRSIIVLVEMQIRRTAMPADSITFRKKNMWNLNYKCVPHSNWCCPDGEASKKNNHNCIIYKSSRVDKLLMAAWEVSSPVHDIKPILFVNIAYFVLKHVMMHKPDAITAAYWMLFLFTQHNECRNLLNVD